MKEELRRRRKGENSAGLRFNFMSNDDAITLIRKPVLPEPLNVLLGIQCVMKR